MTTLVIGANGQIGKQFCERARRAGEPVKAMVRREEQAEWFVERGIDTVVADLEGDFTHAFDGCDEVLFTAGSGPHTGPEKTLLIDLYGAMRAVDIAAQKGLERFIMVSAIRAEDPMAAPDKLRPYMAAKYAADAHLRQATVPHAILKPGRLVDEPASERFAASVEEAGENRISRDNVAVALLHTVQQKALANAEFTLLDGERGVAHVMV